MMKKNSVKRNALAPVVQTLDSGIDRIKIYPLGSAIVFPNTYPLDSDLSRGQRYPFFKKLGPEVWNFEEWARAKQGEDCGGQMDDVEEFG